jgi:hypothetical protein
LVTLKIADTADSIVYLPGFKVEEEGKPPESSRDR